MGGQRIGLIGIKHMGCEHYTNVLDLVEAGQVELVALCDIDESALVVPPVRSTPAEINLILSSIDAVAMGRRLALLHEKMQQVVSSPPSFHTDYRRMMDEVKLDGVIVVTPNFLHREMVEYALARDINVLCEKPLGTDSADCRAMLEAEKHSGAFLQVGLHMRYRRINRAIKGLIDDGALGRVSKITCVEHRDDWYRDGTKVPDKNSTATNWRYLQTATGGSIVEKLCHDLDLFTWWLDDKPVGVYATGGNAVFTDRETIDHADMIVRYEKGTTLNVSLCMYAPNQRFHGRLIGLIGDKAVLDHETENSSFTLYNSDGSIQEFANVEPGTRQGFHAGNATALELDGFIRCIETREKPWADAIVGLRSVMIGELAERSIKEGRVIDVTDWE